MNGHHDDDGDVHERHQDRPQRPPTPQRPGRNPSRPLGITLDYRVASPAPAPATRGRPAHQAATPPDHPATHAPPHTPDPPTPTTPTGQPLTLPATLTPRTWPAAPGPHRPYCDASRDTWQPVHTPQRALGLVTKPRRRGRVTARNPERGQQPGERHPLQPRSTSAGCTWSPCELATSDPQPRAIAATDPGCQRSDTPPATPSTSVRRGIWTCERLTPRRGTRASRLGPFVCEPGPAVLLALRVRGRADRLVRLQAGAESAADGCRRRDEPGQHEQVAVGVR